MAHEITYNNFEISLVVFIPNMTTNHAITYTNYIMSLDYKSLIMVPGFSLSFKVDS